MSAETKVITGKVRLSYANVWEPRLNDQGKEKYSVSIIIPKSDKKTLGAIKKAVDAAVANGVEKHGAKVFGNRAALKLPLRDGDVDRPDDPAYEDSYFLNASTGQAPQIVDQAVNPILDRAEVYSGCYARVSINFYPYDVNGNRGVAAGLGNIQKMGDGEPLGGSTPASAEFGALDLDDTDEAGEDDFLN